MGSGQLNLTGSANALSFKNNSAAAGPGFYNTQTSSTGEAGRSGRPRCLFAPRPGRVQWDVGRRRYHAVREQYRDRNLRVYHKPLRRDPYHLDVGLCIPLGRPEFHRPGSTSANGPWNLRTAIADANPLIDTG